MAIWGDRPHGGEMQEENRRALPLAVYAWLGVGLAAALGVVTLVLFLLLASPHLGGS
jgi:hypothetical protein